MIESRLNLRPEKQSDLPFLLSLYASTRIDVALSGLPDSEKQGFIEMQFHAQRYSYHSNYPNTEFAIVELDRKPVGRLYLSRMPKETRVVDIIVAPQYRSQGIGGCLLRAVQAEAKLDGVAVTLHAEKAMNMAEYYKKFGFEIVEEKEAHYFMEWRAGSSVLVN